MLIPDDDHRALAARLDLCHFEEDAPGMVYWHPRGWVLYRLLEDAARAHVLAAGYREVRAPQLVRRRIWETSGHWREFRSSMFAFGAGAEEAALKPVSCPGHIQLVQRMAPSWRELPLRLAEFGLVHRDEADGALHGLMRLRQFTQDDGHIFCAPDQVADEVARFCRELRPFYRRFGIADLSAALSLRPPNRVGSDEWWDRAERELTDVVASLGIPVDVMPGEGAIYGPKLELILRDRRDRPWQLGTIQLDYVLPQQFDLRYVAPSGERAHVVMLHRALFGSIERFLGVLLEHHGARLPAWLAPDQLALLPVAPRHEARARELLDQTALRVRVDDSSTTLARRIAQAHHDGVPFVGVLGDRELADGTLSVRAGDEQWTAPASEALARVTGSASRPA